MRKTTRELGFEELTAASPDGSGTQDSSAISDSTSGEKGEPGDVGRGNENQGSGTNGNRESGGQQNQNNSEPGGPYGHDSDDDGYDDGIDMSLSTLSSSDTPTALGEDNNEDLESEKVDSDDNASEDSLYADPNVPHVFHDCSTSNWSASGQRIAQENEERLRNADGEALPPGSLFIRESRIGTSPPTSSRLDHNGHPTDLSLKDCRHFNRELEP